MSINDPVTKRIESLLGVIAEARRFDSVSDELSVADLDRITGGVAVPDYQQFIDYVRNRQAKDAQDR